MIDSKLDPLRVAGSTDEAPAANSFGYGKDDFVAHLLQVQVNGVDFDIHNPGEVEIAVVEAYMKLKIYQAGEPVLRQVARPLTPEEIKSAATQQLIELMRETMRDAPGVGLAAPQVGESVQIAVIEDRAEYQTMLPAEILAERERSPVPFHVIINPRIQINETDAAVFFEGCLSVNGYAAVVSRARSVRVECLNEHGVHQVIEAHGWYARILQHEIDHLHGTLYVDKMNARSFVNKDVYAREWHTKTAEEVEKAFRVESERGLNSGRWSVK